MVNANPHLASFTLEESHRHKVNKRNSTMYVCYVFEILTLCL